jgi:hypothetical protein
MSFLGVIATPGFVLLEEADRRDRAQTIQKALRFLSRESGGTL